MKIEAPDPSLQDGVVLLRPWTDRDVPAIAAACNEDELAQWLDQIPHPYTEKDAREYVASTRRGWREGVLRSSRFSARQGRRVDFAMYSLLPGDLDDG